MTSPLKHVIDHLVDYPERMLVIVGSGVSVASSGNHPEASWAGLLTHGINYCSEHLGLPEDWTRLRREQLKLGEFVEVASEISKRLGAPNSGQYAGWLQETLGRIVATEPRLIHALAAWGTPIATTNYDTMISRLTGLETITWQDRAWLVQFLDGEKKWVLHLHGVYTKPETVVLGAHSYEDVVRDHTIQNVMRAMAINKTLVFVGCGPAGLSDPNIGGLIRWYREVLSETVRPSYLLTSESDKEGWQRQLEGSQIRVISYGATHADLPEFLETVAKQASLRRSPRQPIDDLVQVQPSFDQRVQEVLRGKEVMGPGETMCRLMEVVRSHYKAGGRRSAWMAAAGRLREEGKTLLAEERTRIGLELADMMLSDGVPDHAFKTLKEIHADVESGEVTHSRRHQYWELRSRCLQSLGPYVETKLALNQAIASAPDDLAKNKYEAELAEVQFLHGEDA